MTFGLLIMAFEDAVKEGDEQWLFETYKLLLLIDKSHHHPRYAHETLHYLIKVVPSCLSLKQVGPNGTEL